MYYVYCLKSTKDNQYYIGQTGNIKNRLKLHNSGKERSTKNRLPFILLGYEEYQTRSAAMWRETELKKSAHKRKQFFSKFDRLP